MISECTPKLYSDFEPFSNLNASYEHVRDHGSENWLSNAGEEMAPVARGGTRRVVWKLIILETVGIGG